MPYHWPADTDFALWELDVLDRDLSGLWTDDAHLRSPLSPLPYPRRPGAIDLQAQSLPRSPLPRTRQDQEPRTGNHHRPTQLGDRLGCLLLDRPSTVFAPHGDPLDPIRTPGRLRDQALRRRHRQVHPTLPGHARRASARRRSCSAGNTNRLRRSSSASTASSPRRDTRPSTSCGN